MSEISNQASGSILRRALVNANGPIDAEHLSYIIMLGTEKKASSAVQEQAELDFLLILLIHEIRHNEPGDRSYENVYELLNSNDAKQIEPVLKISAFWKPSSEQYSLQQALLGAKSRLLQVLLADDPNFIP